MVIILINGPGKSGKDYLVKSLTRDYVFNFNYVQGIKDIAKSFGYKEERKDKNDREFLHDLKLLTDKYSDFCFLDTLRKVIKVIQTIGPNGIYIKSATIFIHIGEKADIDRMKDYLQSIYHQIGIYSMWIQSNSSIGMTDPRFNGNTDIDNYDIVFENKMNEESVKNFKKLIKKLHKKTNKVSN